MDPTWQRESRSRDSRQRSPARPLPTYARLLFVIGFLVIFTLGGLTGVMLAMVPFNQQTHDSFFVVAHFHYVLIGGVVFSLLPGSTTGCPRSRAECSVSASAAGTLRSCSSSST